MIRKKSVQVQKQSGAVLTLEAAILLVALAICAISFAMIIGTNIPAIVQAWVATLMPPPPAN
ncbi:MAG: hypothetical protein WC627_00135 [Legionella sp.]